MLIEADVQMLLPNYEVTGLINPIMHGMFAYFLSGQGAVCTGEGLAMDLSHMQHGCGQPASVRL